MISEKLLQFIWQYRYYRSQELTTIQGEQVVVLHPGNWNRDGQGPDFQEARVRIGSTLWVGAVELHVRSSDWYHHAHDADERYRQLILHVVYEQDLPANDALLQQYPCIELGGRISRMLIQRYKSWMEQLHPIACSSWHVELTHISELIWSSWKERLLAERWEEKGKRYQEWLQQTHGDWEEVAYWALARGFGMKRNADMFERLASRAPLRLFARYRHIPMAAEAILFGQAGLLQGSFHESYPRELQQLYRFLSHKHQLQPLDPSGWQWLRTRPANFPSVRIAQLATLVSQTGHLLSRWLEINHIQQLRDVFQLRLEEYWLTHYRFDEPAAPHKLSLGEEMIDHLILNVVAPLLWWYGYFRQAPSLQQKALSWVQTLPPEENQIIRRWKQLGIEPIHAADTQALYQLYNQYCQSKRCLHCAIGHQLLKHAHRLESF
ncbi:MAG: DUF2851 family protein [Thermoflavifilum sp.]|nr:DUF2851 family protein [Thermoflavifilum sp.]